MTAQMNRSLKLLRTAAGYAALALAVSVGGVVVGAAVVAPAVAGTKPFVQRVLGEASTATIRPTVLSANAESETSGGSVGQADGDGALAHGAIAPRVLNSFRLGIAGVPRLGWLFVDILLVLAAGFYWFTRRRASGNAITGSELARLSAAALPGRLTPSRLVSGRSSRTPKAVAALAEAGTAPADIARRTGLPLDAVAMLLSLASFGGRQLQPPTA